MLSKTLILHSHPVIEALRFRQAPLKYIMSGVDLSIVNMPGFMSLTRGPTAMKTIGVVKRPQRRTLEVLIVDDDQTILSALEEFSTAFGFHVRIADRPSVAIEMLQKDSCDVVISDVKMPEMSGVKLAQRIRENDPNIHIIFMTSYSFDQTSKEAQCLGADAYLRKPFRANALWEILERLARSPR